MGIEGEYFNESLKIEMIVSSWISTEIYEKNDKNVKKLKSLKRRIVIGKYNSKLLKRAQTRIQLFDFHFTLSHVFDEKLLSIKFTLLVIVQAGETQASIWDILIIQDC